MAGHSTAPDDGRIDTLATGPVGEQQHDLQDVILGLESFGRNVAHELRGPLGGIAGLARLGCGRLDQQDPLAARAILAAIAEQAELSLSLISALFTLARVGDAPLALTRIDPSLVIDDVWRSLAVASPESSAVELVVGELPLVVGDTSLMHLVFTNLIGNAVKFSRHRARPRIEVGATRQPGSASIFVRDNGDGFVASASTRMFEPFVRLHGNRFEGHGLGLAIVRQAMQRQGGEVHAESSARGACFRLLLRAAGSETAL